MPDLDTELRVLRDHVQKSIPQPGLAEIAAQARQRTVRRRMQWGAVAAVLVVSAAVPLLRAGVPADRPAAPPPGQETSEFPNVISVDFFDADHGYATMSDCTASAPRDDCAYQLVATSDGGAHWTKRDLPPTWIGDRRYTFQGMYAVGADEILFDRTTRIGTWERVHSTDGGRSWESVPEPVTTDTIASIPAGGILTSGCGPRLSRAEPFCTTVGTIEPSSGRTMPLANQPPLEDPRPPWYPTEGGSWCVLGDDPRTNGLALSVSRDDGRTWTTSAIDLPAATGWEHWTVAEHDGTLYAMLTDHSSEVPSELLAIFESTDEGATWTRTWELAADKTPRSMLGDPVFTPAGEFLVHSPFDDDTTYASTDGGRTFHVADQQFTGAMQWTRGGYLEYSERLGDRTHRMSPDGVNWRGFTIG